LNDAVVGIENIILFPVGRLLVVFYLPD
jgi:hypothetical protein